MYQQILKVQKVLVLAKEKVKMLERTKSSKRDLLYAQDEVVSSLNRREELVETFRGQKHVSNRDINDMLDKASDLYPEDESSSDGEFDNAVEEESDDSFEFSEETENEHKFVNTSIELHNEADDSIHTTAISNESKSVPSKIPIIIDMENSNEENNHTPTPQNSIQNKINEALQILSPSEKVSQMIKKAQQRNQTKDCRKSSITPRSTSPPGTTNKPNTQTSETVMTNTQNVKDSSPQSSNQQPSDIYDQSNTDDEMETSNYCESDLCWKR